MATSTCPACGANAFVAGIGADGGSCSSCGYTAGEANRCPHCRALARIERSGREAACAVCGGPRIPSNLGGDATAVALRQQKKALENARAASVATVLQAVFAAMATLIALGVAPSSIVGKLLVFLVAVIPLLLAMRSRGRAAEARRHAKDASELAWRAAAEDLASRSKAGVTVARVAEALGIDAEHADRLLTDLTVHDRTRIEVGDDAEVRYSTAPGPRIELEEPPELTDDAESTERGRLR